MVEETLDEGASKTIDMPATDDTIPIEGEQAKQEIVGEDGPDTAGRQGKMAPESAKGLEKPR